MKTIAADLYTCINLSNLIVKPSLFLYLQFIKVMPAVTQIAHTAIRMQFIQQIQINIRNQNHFGIRSRLGPFTISRESEITRSKHSGLGILNVHIVYARQITHTAGYNDKAFILNSPCLSTDAHTE